MAKTHTTAARAAAAIRAQLKSTGLAFTITSKNYSGGNSVTIRLTDAKPAIVALVKELTGKYQIGHFDGMDDSYVYSNRNADLPQVQFAFVENDMTDATRQRVYDFGRGYWIGGDTLPDSYTDGADAIASGEWASTLVHREFTQAGSAYWRSLAPIAIEA